MLVLHPSPLALSSTTVVFLPLNHVLTVYVTCFPAASLRLVHSFQVKRCAFHPNLHVRQGR